MDKFDKYRSDLNSLVDLGQKMVNDLAYGLYDQEELDESDRKLAEKLKGSFENNYQRWYTEASAVIKQLASDRSSEFEQLYKGESKQVEIRAKTYTIQDWHIGIGSPKTIHGVKIFNDLAVVVMRLKTQLDILKSVESRFESVLFDIRQLVQADLFDSELDTARELLKHGFVRGAGAISGVVLEKHLSQVVMNHNITNRKKNPSISDFNDLLKDGEAIDIPLWRKIQRLSDIRNLCNHNKERAPTKEEVEELINGIEKLTKTLF